ncbi:MAG: beta-lactamase family protein [Firmicutes bacterium]|nr:beta-lactamase family protein [Bacillota bacterium]
MNKKIISNRKILIVLIFIFVLVQANTVVAMNDDKIESLLEKHIKDSNLPGIATGIIKNSETIYLDTKGKDGYGDKLTKESPMFIGSLSKSLTALAVMQLVEKDLISLDKPVKKYIPYFKVANPKLSKNITVHDLLIQKSGLSRKKSVPSSDYNNTLKERVKALSTMEEVTENGKEFHYLNDNYNILGLLIEEVTKKSYASYMKEHVFIPIGMKNTTANISDIKQKNIYGYTNIFGFSKKIKQRVPRYDIPSGYIVSNLEDMNKYVSFLIDPSTEILSKESIKKMRMVNGNSDYGMGWHITEVNGLKLIEHSGAVPAFSSHIGIIPETKSGYVYIINKNHLLYNFVHTYDKLNGNLLKIIMGEENFEHFPSIWVIRIASLVILILALKDIWMTKKLIKSIKSKKDWVKESVKSLILLVFLSFGLPFILKNVLAIGFDLKIMLSYVPDFTILLLIAILIQVIRFIVSLFHIIRKNYKCDVQKG